MVLRATQHYLETALLGDSDLRVTQQYVEAALLGDSDLRVTQQYVEVVYTPATDYSLEMSDNLSVSDSVLSSSAKRIAESHTLGISDSTDAKVPIRKSTSNSLSLVDDSICAGPIRKHLQDPMSLSDSEVISGDFRRSLFNTMPLVQYTSLLNFGVEDALGIESYVSHFLAVADRDIPENTINFSQSVINTGNIQNVSHNLMLSQDMFQSGLLEAELAHNLVLNDGVTYCFSAPWTPLEIEHTLLFTDWCTGLAPQTISHSLELSDQVFRVWPISQALSFTQGTSVGSAKNHDDVLTLTQTVATENLLSRGLGSSSLVQQAMAYYIESSCTTKTYNRFEGSGALVGMGPAPLTWDASFALESSSGDLLHLRNPETDDKHRLGFSRINRETQGGELNIYSDPSWITTHTLLFTIVALSDGRGCYPDKIGSVLNFFQTYLGQEIFIHDWEGITWKGIITTPNEVATEDSDSWWTIAFEFEGVAVDGSIQNNQLAITHQIGVQGVYRRSASNDLALDHTMGLVGVVNASASNALELLQPQSGIQEKYILEELFTGDSGTELNGHFPSSVGNSIWRAHSNYKLDGSQVAINSGAYYPFVPASGNIYEIEWNPRSLSEYSGGETLFFLGEAIPAGRQDVGPGAYGAIDLTTLKAGFVLREGEGGQINACRLGDENDGLADTSNMSNEALKTQTGNIDLKIVLDTTAGAGLWRATWYAKSILSSTWIEVRAQKRLLDESILMVGWANDNLTTTVDMDGISILERSTT